MNARRAPGAGQGEIDGRRRRGAQSRKTVLARAIELVSVSGLDGLTIGQLAHALGFSKGRITGLFKTKDALQIAAVEAAIDAFGVSTVKAALALKTPLEPLRALVSGWFTYAEQCPYPGGPIMYALFYEYRGRSGAVRDRIAAWRKSWQDVHVGLIREAQALGQLRRDVNAEHLVFEITAMQSGAEIAAKYGDTQAYSFARTRALDRIANVSR